MPTQESDYEVETNVHLYEEKSRRRWVVWRVTVSDGICVAS